MLWRRLGAKEQPPVRGLFLEGPHSPTEPKDSVLQLGSRSERFTNILLQDTPEVAAVDDPANPLPSASHTFWESARKGETPTAGPWPFPDAPKWRQRYRMSPEATLAATEP